MSNKKPNYATNSSPKTNKNRYNFQLCNNHNQVLKSKYRSSRVSTMN